MKNNKGITLIALISLNDYNDSSWAYNGRNSADGGDGAWRTGDWISRWTICLARH